MLADPFLEIRVGAGAPMNSVVGHHPNYYVDDFQLSDAMLSTTLKN